MPLFNLSFILFTDGVSEALGNSFASEIPDLYVVTHLTSATGTTRSLPRITQPTFPGGLSPVLYFLSPINANDFHIPSPVLYLSDPPSRSSEIRSITI